LASAPNGAAPPFPLLCSFRPRAGLVTSRETFVRRRRLRDDHNPSSIGSASAWSRRGAASRPPGGLQSQGFGAFLDSRGVTWAPVKPVSDEVRHLDALPGLATGPEMPLRSCTPEAEPPALPLLILALCALLSAGSAHAASIVGC